MRRSQFPDEKILAIVKEGELSWFIDGSLVKSRAYRTHEEALARHQARERRSGPQAALTA